MLLLAATNRVDVLDPALLRPGRLSRKVRVPLPDEPGRRDVLAVHLRSTPLAPGVGRAEAAARLAAVTSGFSGAELANVVNEAALLAARRDREVVTLRDLLEGVQRTRFGVDGRTRGPDGVADLTTRVRSWLLNAAASGSLGGSLEGDDFTAGGGGGDRRVRTSTGPG